MKANILVSALLLFIIGCTPHQSDRLTQQQKDQIKSEVKATMDSLITEFERMDAKREMEFYWDSPDFVAFNPDGSRSDFVGYDKIIMETFNSAAAIKVLTTREDVIVLTEDLAVCGWSGTTRVTLKSGGSILFDPDALTFVFRKLTSKWKIIYTHESGTITTQKAGKK